MNKIIIPAAMLAVGVALVGSISSTLAWYQYSTKAQAAFIGTSVGKAENLEILTANGTTWKSNLTSTDVNALAATSGQYPNLLPVTPGITVAKDGAIPAKTAFKEGIETGVNGYRGDAQAANVIQFDLKMRYKKTADEVTYEAKKLKLSDLTIMNNANNTKGADLYKTLRVHLSVVGGSGNYLFANDTSLAATEFSINTFGNLDTDNDNEYDKQIGYEWEEKNPVIYGNDGTTETSYNASALDLENNPLELGQLAADENGTTIRVTIWIEGWHKLSGIDANNKDYGSDSHTAAVWDPTQYVGQKFNIGLRFQAEDIQ